MRAKGFLIEGVIIKRINFSEADKIITIFTKQKGKIVCLAKGIRKICSKRGPCLELFNLIKAYVIKGKNLDLLTEVALIKSFPYLSKKLKIISNCFYLVELVDRLTAEHQENRLIYNLLLDFLQKVNNLGCLTEREIIDFQKKILIDLGFGLPRQINQQTLESHIENIINHKINSKSFL